MSSGVPSTNASGIGPARSLPQNCRKVGLQHHQVGAVHFQKRHLSQPNLRHVLDTRGALDELGRGASAARQRDTSVQGSGRRPRRPTSSSCASTGTRRLTDAFDLGHRHVSHGSFGLYCVRTAALGHQRSKPLTTSPAL